MHCKSPCAQRRCEMYVEKVATTIVVSALTRCLHARCFKYLSSFFCWHISVWSISFATRDDIREDVFSKVNYGRMIHKGTALSASHQIITILRNRYGRDETLFDKQSTPTLAVCCMGGSLINTIH